MEATIDTGPARSANAAAKAASTRPGFLGAAAAGAAALPTLVSARALGLDGAAAASDRIGLGVIGMGNRCRYVLDAMLKLPDVQCVAIADVQASSRGTTSTPCSSPRATAGTAPPRCWRRRPARTSTPRSPAA